MKTSMQLPVLGTSTRAEPVWAELPLPYRPEQQPVARPITAIVVKVASRCNIGCTYCYMYEAADDSWRHQPKFISEEHTALLARRLSEYAHLRGDPGFTIIAHGGEPLMMGTGRLGRYFSILSEHLDAEGVTFGFGIQTNGTLLTPEIVELLHHYSVRVGVSLDGPQRFNDRFRVDNSGRGTFESVMAGVEQLRNSESNDAWLWGFLSVANPEIPPQEMYSFFFDDIGARGVDFLLPLYNHDTFAESGLRPGEMGEWLVELFDLWFPNRGRHYIRCFDTLLRLVRNRGEGTDAWGELSDGVLYVETDGTLRANDLLRTAYDRASEIGATLADTRFVDLEMHPAILAGTDKASAASDTCLACDLYAVCGGRLISDRYSAADGFNHESVYCEDMKMLIRHIEATERRDVLALLTTGFR